MSEKKKRVACPQCDNEGFLIVWDWELPEGVKPEPGSLVVRCSSCDQRYRIRWEGQMRLRLAGDVEPSELEIGDVLQLKQSFNDLPEGMWAVVETGWIMRLARCAENEDGYLSMTYHTVTITQDEARRFRATKRRLEPPITGADSPQANADG